MTLINLAPQVYGTRWSGARERLLDRPPSETEAADALWVSEDVRTLMGKELRATRLLHGAIEDQCGHDSRATWIATTLAKRALYLSLPAVVLDPLEQPVFRRDGVNGRVHLLRGRDPRESVRLEATCTFQLGEARARYAIALQYAHDGAWQVLRPAILLDPRVGAMLAPSDRRARGALLVALRLLEVIASQGIHDYLHGTMMRWFAPPRLDCPRRYGELLVDTPTPDPVLAWQDGLDGRVSGPLYRGRLLVNADPLEHWSLIVHARTAARLMAEEPARAAALRRLLGRQLALLGQLADAVRGEEHQDVLALVGGLSSFFFSLVVPPGSPRPSSWERGEEVAAYARALHGGLVEKVHAYDPDHFVWTGRNVEIFDVLREYAPVVGARTAAVA